MANRNNPPEMACKELELVLGQALALEGRLQNLSVKMDIIDRYLSTTEQVKKLEQNEQLRRILTQIGENIREMRYYLDVIRGNDPEKPCKPLSSRLTKK